MSKTIPTDNNGYFTALNRPFSKVGVFPYLGSSIGALNPDKIYMVYRPESELSNEDTINSFKLVPLIDEHEMLGKDATPAEKKGVEGTTGEDVYFKDGTLYGNLKVYSESMKNQIEGGKKELSLGYKCEYVFEVGNFEGVRYEAIQTNLRGNHIALVEEGRMGKEVSVVDSALKTVVTMDRNDIKSMKGEDMEKGEMKDLLNELYERLDVLEDALKKKEGKDNEDKPKDGKDEEEKAKDSDNKAKDNKDEEKVKDNKDEKKGEDKEAGEDSEEKTLDELKAENEKLTKKVEDMEQKMSGMDSSITQNIMKEFSQKNKLADRLSPIIGSFDHSDMRLSDVVKYGCTKLNLNPAKGQESATLEGFLAGAKVTSSNVNSAGMDSNIKAVGLDPTQLFK